jgi:uncharacterized damage-inducible protein DinB
MKTRILLTTLALSASIAPLAAQQFVPKAGPPGKVLTTAFYNESEQYAQFLLTAFDSIPASKYDFHPMPGQMTVGDVAQHLEYANYLFCTLFSGTPHPTTAKDSLPDSVKARWPKDTLVARLRASAAFCRAAFEKLTDANLSDSIATTFPFRAKKNLRGRIVLLYTTDLVDHYSQIANYMRLNGLLPPSAYPPPKK